MKPHLPLAVACILATCACAVAKAEALPLTLAQAEERLFAANRDILAARRALEGARAGTTIAGQAPNPMFTAQSTSINPRRGVGAGPLTDKAMDTTLRLDQLIERGSKRERRTAVAEELERAARLDLADTRRQLRLALHQAYYDLKQAQEKVALSSETALLYQRSIDAGERRLKAGDISAVDLSRLRIDALRTQNEARATLAELSRTRQNLAFLIGLESRAQDLDAVDPWPEAKPADNPGLPDDVRFEQRPDVLAASARATAARLARDLAQSQRTRDITVGAQVERFPPESGVTYGISVSMPLFLRNSYEGEIAKAEADYAAARDAGERALAAAKSDAVSARADLLAAEERMHRLATQVLSEAQHVAAAAEFAYSKGAVALLDLLDARRTLRSVGIETASARAEFAKARAAWLAATAWETGIP